MLKPWNCNCLWTKCWQRKKSLSLWTNYYQLDASQQDCANEVSVVRLLTSSSSAHWASILMLNDDMPWAQNDVSNIFRKQNITSSVVMSLTEWMIRAYVHSNVFSEHIDTNSYHACVMILPFAVYIADQVHNESIKLIGTKERKNAENLIYLYVENCNIINFKCAACGARWNIGHCGCNGLEK